jgi:hypothetical protein
MAKAKFNAHRLPASMQTNVMDFLDENKVDKRFVDLTMEEFLDYYLKWNGIIGYTSQILRIVENGTEREKIF